MEGDPATDIKTFMETFRRNALDDKIKLFVPDNEYAVYSSVIDNIMKKMGDAPKKTCSELYSDDSILINRIFTCHAIGIKEPHNNKFYLDVNSAFVAIYCHNITEESFVKLVAYYMVNLYNYCYILEGNTKIVFVCDVTMLEYLKTLQLVPIDDTFNIGIDRESAIDVGDVDDSMEDIDEEFYLDEVTSGNIVDPEHAVYDVAHDPATFRDKVSGHPKGYKSRAPGDEEGVPRVFDRVGAKIFVYKLFGEILEKVIKELTGHPVMGFSKEKCEKIIEKISILTFGVNIESIEPDDHIIQFKNNPFINTISTGIGFKRWYALEICKKYFRTGSGIKFKYFIQIDGTTALCSSSDQYRNDMNQIPGDLKGDDIISIDDILLKKQDARFYNNNDALSRFYQCEKSNECNDTYDPWGDMIDLGRINLLNGDAINHSEMCNKKEETIKIVSVYPHIIMSNLSIFIQFMIVGLARLNSFELEYNEFIRKRNLKKKYLGITTMIGPSRNGDQGSTRALAGRRLDVSKFSLINLDNLFSHNDNTISKILHSPPDLNITYCKNCSIFGEDLVFNTTLNNRMNDIRTLCYTKLAKINFKPPQNETFQQESKLNYIEFYIKSPLNVDTYPTSQIRMPPTIADKKTKIIKDVFLADTSAGFPIHIPLKCIKCASSDDSYNDPTIYCVDNKKIKRSVNTYRKVMTLYNEIGQGKNDDLGKRFMYSSTIFKNILIKNNFNSYYKPALISSYFIMLWGIAVLNILSAGPCLLDYKIHNMLKLKGNATNIDNIVECLAIIHWKTIYADNEKDPEISDISRIKNQHIKDIAGIAYIVFKKINNLSGHYESLSQDFIDRLLISETILCTRIYALLFANSNCHNFQEIWTRLYNSLKNQFAVHDNFLAQHKNEKNFTFESSQYVDKFNGSNEREFLNKKFDNELILNLTDDKIMSLGDLSQCGWMTYNIIIDFVTNQSPSISNVNGNDNFNLIVALLKIIKKYFPIGHRNELDIIYYILKNSVTTHISSSLIDFIDANSEFILKYVDNVLDDASRKLSYGYIEADGGVNFSNVMPENGPHSRAFFYGGFTIDCSIDELLKDYKSALDSDEVNFIVTKYTFNKIKPFLATLVELRKTLFGI